MTRGWIIVFYAFLHCWICRVKVGAHYVPVPTPPLPLSPMPSASQLKFQARRMSLFIHFGMNTFTDQEWGDGTTDPDEFNPVGLDTRQWMRVAKETGFQLVILTVKHHDGFCLWQTEYTDYSVGSSSRWRNGTGDVFMDFVTAARDAQLDVGFYLSPWDRHEKSYGDSVDYNQFYMAQLRELLTRYGPISEVWLDGAKGPNAKNMTYMFKEWEALIHQLQPGANIFSNSGPDIRWVGNENGEAGSTCWSMINRTKVQTQDFTNFTYLTTGDALGTHWIPPECDVSIRPGWFWHSTERPWPVEKLLDIFYKSAGRNCVLLLNVPPNSTGLISEADFRVLLDFRNALNYIFDVNLAASAAVSASSTRGEGFTVSDDQNGNPFSPSQVVNGNPATYWAAEDGITEAILRLDFQSDVQFNVLEIQEAIGLGQRISKYSVFRWDARIGKECNDGEWVAIHKGTTVGYRKLDRVNVVRTRRVRIVIEDARGPPIITSVGLYLDTQHSYSLWTLTNQTSRMAPEA
ncbi:hypothetical protein R1flu_005786 [Riccia fluitans]|uniref:alpha-L-fucosidase n=1 Tax=Riccia fluitans TaxID=41844 RepID=A0ABD1YU61_9MARC